MIKALTSNIMKNKTYIITILSITNLLFAKAHEILDANRLIISTNDTKKQESNKKTIILKSEKYIYGSYYNTKIDYHSNIDELYSFTFGIKPQFVTPGFGFELSHNFGVRSRSRKSFSEIAFSGSYSYIQKYYGLEIKLREFKFQVRQKYLRILP